MTIIEHIAWAIAEAEEKQPDELAFTLQDYVDTDAVRLLANHDNSSWTLDFEVPNHTVRVTGQGAVFVDDVQQRRPDIEC